MFAPRRGRSIPAKAREPSETAIYPESAEFRGRGAESVTPLQSMPCVQCGPRFAFTMIVASSVFFASHFGVEAADRGWYDDVRPFLEQHCGDCHRGAAGEGGFDLARLAPRPSGAAETAQWIRIHDRLAAGEMPPPDAAQPSGRSRSKALELLADTLVAREQALAKVVLRRLNRSEYENTVRDLFGVWVDVKDQLPEDSSTDGFDNVGEGLNLSAEAIAAYLQAAEQTLDAVFGPPTEPKRIEFKTNLLDQRGHDGSSFIASHIGKMFRRTPDGLVIFQSGYCPTTLVNFSRLRAPVGTYRGTIRARAVQSDKPVTLRIYAGDTLVNRRERHLVGHFDVPPDRWTTIEFTDRLVEEGGTFQPTCYGTRDTRKDADTYPEPGIEIGDITIEGPLEQWPPASRIRLLSGLANGVDQGRSIADAERILSRLLPRAFRRDVDPEELRPYLDFFIAALESGRGFEPSLRLSLSAILCSPSFLFLEETTRTDAAGRQRIDESSLACRLSYFLTSSLPDDELRQLAQSGRLSIPSVLRDQVERLLASPAADAFVDNFTGQWLDLRRIDETSPDAKLFPEFDELLKLSMVEETRMFFSDILENNLSLLNFVDSRHTFLNERLAAHYGIEGVTGQTLRKVSLPEASVRGGLLGQASILKVTANGTHSSPVLRGVWVLDKLLGQTLPPPPENVPAVEPDIRGSTTIREQLRRHREIGECATCHDRIDPPGFALEGFDPIGGFRTQYRTSGDGKRPAMKQAPFTFNWVQYRLGLPVDSSGITADAVPFAGVHDFRRWLHNRPDEIAEALTEKVLTYALGRSVRFSDRRQVDDIVQSLRDHDYGFRELIHAVVQSDAFQQP